MVKKKYISIICNIIRTNELNEAEEIWTFVPKENISIDAY